MSNVSQAVIHRRLKERYLRAVLSGGDQVVLHINEIADICDYLNSRDQSNVLIHKPFVDDAEPAVIETFIKLREKDLGAKFNDFDKLRGNLRDDDQSV